MNTYATKPSDIERKWYVVDASGVVLGRLSAEIAKILRGKHKPNFVPNLDCGDYVIVINAEKVKLTGKKLTDKVYYRHTGWIGGLKEVKYRLLMEERPEFAMELAVKGMLPKNSIGRNSMKRIRIYKGAEHKNAAQKPEVWALD